ncbi:MAG: hypothetical protein HQL38_20810, partial [Alphaproteobacteria bacterium]|nr:hypothetical protein [Alphaproteobacteria bacterium]
MSAKRGTSFEVQVLRDKHWTIAEVKTSEEQAKAFADDLLQKGNHEAVRVVRDYQRMDGLHTETVILEKTADSKKTDLNVAAVTESPVCRELADFYALESRLVIGRLFRSYLDEAILTPTEILHTAKELKRLGDKDRLLFSGIDIVATLQQRATGEDRRDFLQKAWDKIVARARDAESRLPADKAFAAILKAVPGEPGFDTDFRRNVLIARHLMEARSWVGKLDLLLGWAAEPEAAKAMHLIDGVVAELMLPAQMIQDLLGFQSNLGAALLTILDLADGKAGAAKWAPGAYEALNRLFAENRLPQSRDVLLTRVIREMRGTNALSRNEPKQEFEWFHKMLHRTVDHARVLGGGAMAEALVQRYVRMFNLTDGKVAADAMQGLFMTLTDGCRRVQLTLALAESPLAAVLGDELPEALTAQVRSGRTIDWWVPVRVPPRDRMTAMTAVHKSVISSAAFAEPLRTDLGNRIDEALARYLLDEEVIEKIDKADDPLALRAIRLVKFCGSGVLIDGKSLDLARQRVIGHLRQSQFEQRFLASVPD